MLLSPLPYRDSSRLVFVWSDMSEAGYPRAPLSGPELADLRAARAAVHGLRRDLGEHRRTDRRGRPRAAPRRPRDDGLLLGARRRAPRAAARSARATTGADAPPTILLSAALWRRRFGGDPAVVGRRILVNGQPTTVIGVMPDSFRLLLPPDSSVPDDLEAWLPFRPQHDRGPARAAVPARRRPHEARRHARAGQARDRRHRGADLEGIPRVRQRRPSLRHGRPPGRRRARDPARAARALRRRRDPAAHHVRQRRRAPRRASGVAAPGDRAADRARRGTPRLFRQCLVEGLVLAALGAAAGVAVARAALAALFAARPESLSPDRGGEDRPARARVHRRHGASVGRCSSRSRRSPRCCGRRRSRTSSAGATRLAVADARRCSSPCRSRSASCWSSAPGSSRARSSRLAGRRSRVPVRTTCCRSASACRTARYESPEAFNAFSRALREGGRGAARRRARPPP